MMKKGILYALITAVLFTTLEPASKLIANNINPYAITFWRFFIGAVILIPPAAAKIKSSDIHIGIKDLGKLTLLGILFICVSMVSLQLAVKEANSPSLIAIIFSANSIFTILLSVLINKECLTRNKIIALISGIIGVALCADFNAGTNLQSVTLAVFAALSFSLYTVLSQKYTKKICGIVQSAIVFMAGSIVLLVVLLVFGIDVSFSYNLETLSIMLYLGIAVTGIGYASYFMAIEKGGAIMASLSFFIKPVITPFAVLLINGIVPAPKIFIAIAFIMTASYFATYKNPRKP